MPKKKQPDPGEIVVRVINETPPASRSVLRTKLNQKQQETRQLRTTLLNMLMASGGKLETMQRSALTPIPASSSVTSLVVPSKLTKDNRAFLEYAGQLASLERDIKKYQASKSRATTLQNQLRVLQEQENILRTAITNNLSKQQAFKSQATKAILQSRKRRLGQGTESTIRANYNARMQLLLNELSKLREKLQTLLTNKASLNMYSTEALQTVREEASALEQANQQKMTLVQRARQAALANAAPPPKKRKRRV